MHRTKHITKHTHNVNHYGMFVQYIDSPNTENRATTGACQQYTRIKENIHYMEHQISSFGTCSINNKKSGSFS